LREKEKGAEFLGPVKRTVTVFKVAKNELQTPHFFTLIIRRGRKIAFASNCVTYHYRITMGMVTYVAPAVEKSSKTKTVE
jgi:hypothetical protein